MFGRKAVASIVRASEWAEVWAITPSPALLFFSAYAEFASRRGLAEIDQANLEQVFRQERGGRPESEWSSLLAALGAQCRLPSDILSVDDVFLAAWNKGEATIRRLLARVNMPADGLRSVLAGDFREIDADEAPPDV